MVGRINLKGQKMKRIIGLGIILLIVLTNLAFPAPAASQTGTVVRVHPAQVTLNPGESAVIEIWVDEVTDLVAFSVQINFDPSRLSADSLQHGPFLDIAFQEPTNGINNGLGTIRYGNAQGPSSQPKSGSGVLFSFQITAKAISGETSLSITTADLVDEDILLIPCQVANGTVKVTGDDGNGFLVYLPLIIK